LPRITAAQECDARNGDSTTKAGNKIVFYLLNKLLTKFYFQQFECTPVNN